MSGMSKSIHPAVADHMSRIGKAGGKSVSAAKLAAVRENARKARERRMELLALKASAGAGI